VDTGFPWLSALATSTAPNFEKHDFGYLSCNWKKTWDLSMFPNISNVQLSIILGK
jgi:hypothetical protein